MDNINDTSQEKKTYRFLILLFLLGICCFLTFYSSLVLNTTTVYSHFFYIPIFLSSLWWRKRGITVVLFLSSFLLITYNLTGDGISYFDYLRVGALLFVGIFLTLTMDRVSHESKTSIDNINDKLRNYSLKESSKISLIVILIILSCSLTVYFHVVENKGTVFSHFFYIPIILSAIWWQRRGLPVAFFLAAFLLFGHFFLRDYVVTINDFFRATMFIIVPLIISFFSKKIAQAEGRINYLTTIVSLIQSVNKLVIQEFNRERLIEGIASAIAENPGYISVKVALYDENGKPQNEVTRYNSRESQKTEIQQTRYKQPYINDLSATNPGKEYKNRKSSSISYPIEYESFGYGYMSIVLKDNNVNNKEQRYMLESVADELAYALFNLEVSRGKKIAEEELRLDNLRIQTISEFSKITGSTYHEMILYTLQEAVSISKSETGYIAFIDNNKLTVEIITPRTEDPENKLYTTDKKYLTFKDIELISDILKRRSALVTDNPDKLKQIEKIYGENCPALKRHIDIPIIDSGQVVAVAGLANRENSYSDSIIKNTTHLLQGMWNILKHRKTEEELALYRDNLQEMVKTRTEELEYTNNRLTIELREKNILNKNLEEASRELESFVHSVTHDLKSPLFSMKLCMDMLKKNHSSGMNQECLELLQQIKKENTRMEELIKDVLVLSKAGVENDIVEEIDILKLLLDISGRFEYCFEEKSIEYIIRVSVPEPVPAVVANRSQVIQVFENLITNAVKYIGNTEDPCILLCIHSISKNFCYFYIEDNGIGIDKKNHENIFKEFYRTHDIDADGTGIGLAIVKKIIEKHGGEVSVSSEPRKGSTFYFSLPVKQN